MLMPAGGSARSARLLVCFVLPLPHSIWQFACPSRLVLILCLPLGRVYLLERVEFEQLPVAVDVGGADTDEGETEGGERETKSRHEIQIFRGSQTQPL